MEDLQTFVEVADAGGVSPAARRLGVSKSIVSRRLFRLEEDLGVQLLARTTRGAALTEAGMTFRDHAARVCAEIDLARETILPAGDSARALAGRRTALFRSRHLAPVFAELARRHPRLQVHTSYTDRFVDLIGEGFDCGIRVGFLNDSNLIARRIGPIHGKLVASPEYRENGLPKRLTNSSRISLSCKAPRRGTSSTETRRSPCIRKVNSKQTTVLLLRQQPSPGLA